MVHISSMINGEQSSQLNKPLQQMIELRQQLKRLIKQQSNDQQKIKKLQQLLQDEEHHRNALEVKLQQSEESNKKLTDELQYLKEKQGLNKPVFAPLISHYPNSPHQLIYNLTFKTYSTAIVSRIGGIGRQNFVNQQLSPLQTKYSVKILKATDSDLMIGFCTQKGLGNIPNYDCIDSAYYWCWGNGWTYQGGAYKQFDDLGSLDGETITCWADIKEGTINWQKGGKEFAKCGIPSEMVNKKAYFSIILCYVGDEVEINIK